MNNFDHGGNIYSYKKKLLDLSSNINHLKPKIDLSDVDISPYPDIKYKKLKKKVANFYKTDKKYVSIFSGATDAIYSLFAHLKPKDVVIYSPTYLEYKRSAQIFKTNVTLINREDHNSQTPKNSLVIFVNPSTPDGKYYKLKPLIKCWIKNNNTVLIDESFLDFSNKKSVLNMILKSEKIYILKSFSKLFSCGGVRVGAIISTNKDLINLQNEDAKWKISSFDEKYIITILDNKKHITKTKKIVKKNRIILKKVLVKSKLFSEISNSCANYILVKSKNKTAKEIQKTLLNKKILIRDCSNFDFLTNQHIRIAVKGKSSIKKLSKALKYV